LLFILPTSFIVTILSNANLSAQLSSAIGGRATNVLKTNHLVLVAIIYALSQLAKGLKGVVSHYSKPNSALDREDILSILESINQVVLAKSERFLRDTKKSLSERWISTDIFNNITQPTQQIGLLACGVKGVFEYLQNDEVEFRVGLMSIKDNKPDDWFAFAPTTHPPRTSPDRLSSPTSTIMRALTTGTMIIVSDIQAELKKNSKVERNIIKGNIQPHDSGSILACPIYCPNVRKPIYVLSILGNKKNCLEEKHRELYTWVLDHFITRLILEHHLYILKREAA
jgi:hypothetical protein